MKKILLILFLLPVIASGQVKQIYPQYGGKWKRLVADSAWGLPKVAVGLKDQNLGFDTAQIRYNIADSSVYVHTGSGWILLRGAGGGGGITALTGDVTATGPGSVAATLATVNGNVGSFTYGSFTVNAKGLITAASSGVAPSIPTWQNTLTAGSTLTTDNKITLNTTNFNIVKSGIDTMFKIDPVNLQYGFGDMSGVGNATSIHITDDNATVRVDGNLQIQAMSNVYNDAHIMWPLYWDQTNQYLSVTSSTDSLLSSQYGLHIKRGVRFSGLPNLSTQNRLLGQFGTDGNVGYVTLGAGLSLASGVLNTAGGFTGSGTLNFVPKWTPNGTTLGNSQIFDDGTGVGIGTTTTTFDAFIAQTTILSAKNGNVNGQLSLVDNTAQATGVGGTIGFVGKYSDAGDYALGARIAAQKTNSINGEYGFDLGFWTREHSGSVAQKMVLTSTGNVSIPIGTLTVGATNAIVGTATNNNATAGNIGEEVNSTVSTYANYTTTATYQNITSITLTAGDWDISAFMTYSSNAATITAASNAIFVISTTTASAAGATEGKNIAYVPQAALLGTSLFSESISPYRVSLAGTTTYYLNTQATFTLGNPQYAGSIRARRLR